VALDMYQKEAWYMDSLYYQENFKKLENKEIRPAINIFLNIFDESNGNEWKWHHEQVNCIFKFIIFIISNF
jgi:hypothetical protein